MSATVIRCLWLLSLIAGSVACTGGASSTLVAPTRSEPNVQSSAAACPTTQPPNPAFVPRPPYPALPPGSGGFWLGGPSLWTVLPGNGLWGQLALGEKFWWWSEEFDARIEPVPALVVTGRRLDGAAPVYSAGPATHGWSTDLYEAMLVGIDLPASGCWELVGDYRGHRLAVVVWVSP